MKKLLYIGILSALLLTLPGCGNTYAMEQFSDFSVDTVKASRKQLESTVDVAGVLTPNNTAVVSAKLSGSVNAVNASVGQKVKAGDVLVSLDTKELDAQLASAKAAYNSTQSQADLAKVNLDAAQSGLDVTHSAVNDQVDAAKIGLDAAKIALDAATEQSNLQLQQSQLQIDQAQIGIQNAQNNLNSANDALDTAQKNFDRTKQLVESDVSPQANLDSAQSSLNTAQAGVRAAQSGLEQAQTALKTAQAAYNMAVQSSKASKDAAQSKYDSAKASYNQASGSGAQSQIVTAQGRVDTAKEQYKVSSSTALEQAQAAVNAIEVQLPNAQISANISGVVVNRNINEGEIAAAGTPLFTLADVSKLKLKGTISQDALPFVKEGQNVDVVIDIYPDKTFPGTVTGVGPIAVSTGSYFPCEITIDNPDDGITAGVSAHAAIHITGSDHICVPNSAVVQNNGQTYVFVINGNIAYKKEIVSGLKNDSETEILRGVDEGEAVAVSNVNTLFDQMPIQS